MLKEVKLSINYEADQLSILWEHKYVADKLMLTFEVNSFQGNPYLGANTVNKNEQYFNS